MRSKAEQNQSKRDQYYREGLSKKISIKRYLFNCLKSTAFMFTVVFCIISIGMISGFIAGVEDMLEKFISSGSCYMWLRTALFMSIILCLSNLKRKDLTTFSNKDIKKIEKSYQKNFEKDMMKRDIKERNTKLKEILKDGER